MPTTLASPRSKNINTGRRTFAFHTPQMFDMLDDLLNIAPHDVTLLLVGETGTGKTTMARLVHELSPRKDEKLLTVACGALPADLIESELFGHVKGAFTGASCDKEGKFTAASKGTLLLDEIDVLDPSQQAKLLRVIETGEYEAVGSNDTRHSTARLIAASNVNLHGLMEREEFRADLYYRLNVLEFHIPPLRDRADDIEPLCRRFIQEFCAEYHVDIRAIHSCFWAAVRGYHWPGNIRELRNHIRRSVLFNRSGEMSAEDLSPIVVERAPNGAPQSNGLPKSDVAAYLPNSPATDREKSPTSLSQQVATSEQEILESALRANNYKRSATAASLGISRVGLYKKMKKYGMIDPRNGNH